MPLVFYIWETVHDLAFNCGEFAIVKSWTDFNNPILPSKKWIETKGAVSIYAKSRSGDEDVL